MNRQFEYKGHSVTIYPSFLADMFCIEIDGNQLFETPHSHRVVRCMTFKGAKSIAMQHIDEQANK